MAQLTWRDVAGPNLGNPQDSINAAARLLASSTTGLSGALTQFGDQQALQQLAAYTDAQKLQADIQSGRFNTANASPEALVDIMKRPASLIENQTNQQQAAYRKDLNPLLLASQGTQNDQAEYNLSQDKDAQNYLEKVTRPNAKTDRERADGVWVRNEKTRELLDSAKVDVNKRLTDGSLSTVNQARDLLKSVSAGPQEITAFYTQALSGRFPELTAAPIAPPIASGIGSFGSVQVPGTSVGERNNNQGNLMGTGWVTSMPGYLGNDEKGFARFSTNEQGTAANNKQLERYWEGTEATGGKPVRTIDGIINTWAPVATANAATGNSPESVANYKKYVQTRTGIDMTKELTKEQLGPVRAAMQEFETGNRPTTQQLSNTSAAFAAQNTMARVAANTPEVERWLGAISTPGDGSLAAVASSLKKGNLADMDLGRIRQRLAETARATETTGDYRLAAQLLEASAGGDTTLNIFGPGPMGWQSDTNDDLLKANIDKYNKRSTTTDAIQTGRSLDQGTAALAETQKQVEALKAYRDAKKIELAEGVYGVTQDDVTKADVALNQALGQATQIQSAIESFRPKTESETKSPAATPTSDAPTNVSAPIAASLIEAAAKSDIPIKVGGRNRFELDIPETIRNPSVQYYQQIPNPLYAQLKVLKGKTFPTRADAEKAYKDALK